MPVPKKETLKLALRREDVQLQALLTRLEAECLEAVGEPAAACTVDRHR
jgi:hypothetical protein